MLFKSWENGVLHSELHTLHAKFLQEFFANAS